MHWSHNSRARTEFARRIGARRLGQYPCRLGSWTTYCPADGNRFVAENPGYGWEIEFDGRGFLTTPKIETWSWGLEILSYGFAGWEQELSELRSISADANRVVVGWDGQLEE